MLTENDVVKAVCDYLRSRGYEIERCLATDERGSPDIIAVKSSGRVLVEAKGDTSNRPGSGRFGKAFNSGQRSGHVGRALMVLLAAYGKPTDRLALALPASHAYLIEERQKGLDAIGVGVFLVNDEKRVVYKGPWQV